MHKPILTEKQKLAIEGILASDYMDGDHPVGRPVWSWSCNTFDNRRSFGGVVASLVKRGFVVHSRERNKINGRWRWEFTLTLTQAGFDAFAEAHKAD